MKKNLQLLIILTLFTGISFGQVTYHATRTLKSTDVNTDPGWKWYQNTIVQLYVEPNQPPVNRLMPWFDNNGTAAIALNTGSNSTRDMYPSDGWVLVYRDFGTTEIEQKWPHFILYNRYKGILRLFFIDFFETTQKTVYAIKFYHKNNTIASANISSNSQDKVYLDLYDPNHSQIGICRATPGQWAYVDFDVTTYDPNLPDNLGFAFEVNSILQGNLELFANKLEEVDDKTPTVFDGINSIIKKSEAGIALGKKYFSTPKGFLEDMKKHADNNKGKWFENSLRTIGNSTIANSIPIIGGVAGIITGFIGDDKGAGSTFVPFKITGDIKFESPIADFFIWAPGSNRTETNGKGEPLYDKPLGIIGVYRPLIGTLTWGCGGKQLFNLDYVINPEADIKVSDLQLGFKTDDELITYYSEKDFFNTFIWDKGDNYDIVVSMQVNSVCYPAYNTYIIKTFGNIPIECGNWLDTDGRLNWGNGTWEDIDWGKNSYITDMTIWSDGTAIWENCTAHYSSPTSITIEPGMHIVGGDVSFSVRYNGTYQKYLNNSFECNEVIFEPSQLKRASIDFDSKPEILPNKSLNSLQNSIQIYPNPFDNVIYFNSTDFATNLHIKIYNLNGSVLYNKFHKNNGHIATDFLNTGMYFIEIANNGSVIKREKIVKY